MAKRQVGKDNREFRGVWIPAEYWLDENLSIREVVLITEVDSLARGVQGCFASNSHLAKFLGITASRCSQIISKLVDEGYLTAEYDRKPSGEVIKRRLRVVNKLTRGIEKIDRGYLENCEESNTTSNTSNNTSSRKSKTYDKKSPYYVLADLLLKWIQNNNPNAKTPNLQKWADDMRKIVELDKRQPNDVKRVIVWCQKDDFWSTNILSASKLRKQYDQLFIKMTKEATKPNPLEPPMSDAAKQAADEAKLLAEQIEQEREVS